MKKGNAADTWGIYAVVTFLRALGKSLSEIKLELRNASGGEASRTIFPEIEQLPAAIISDEAIDVLPMVLRLLEDFSRPADAATYASFMAAQLRRRDYGGVAATASKLSGESLTFKMLAILATAAAGRKELEDMKSGGHFQPDEIMYNAILDGCAKQRRVTESLQTLDETQVLDVRPFGRDALHCHILAFMPLGVSRHQGLRCAYPKHAPHGRHTKLRGTAERSD